MEKIVEVKEIEETEIQTVDYYCGGNPWVDTMEDICSGCTRENCIEKERRPPMYD